MALVAWGDTRPESEVHAGVVDADGDECTGVVLCEGLGDEPYCERHAFPGSREHTLGVPWHQGPSMTATPVRSPASHP
jgi:hypothetical protein